MTDHTKRREALEALLKVATNNPPCECSLSSMLYRHYGGCEFIIAVNARVRLGKLGFKRINGEHPAAASLIAMSKAYGDCDHLLEPNALGDKHAFAFGSGPRNIYNPFSPTCSKCGRSIGDIVNELRAALSTVPEVKA